jgi:NitT/TauT family transport system ATP-binding protein
MLKVTHLNKTFGSGPTATEAVGDLTFEVGQQEFVCIVGPSGCGKTTLLRTMSGLLTPTSGQVELDGKRVSGPPEKMALVFQEYSRSLYPWMKVGENIQFPLRRKKMAKSERRRAVEDAVESVGLTGFIDKYPWQLSGGMQQRVAIARALAYQPEILLMDEPFASVDAQTRADLEDLVLRVRHEYGVTVVFVTHDIDESVYLADRVLILSPRPTRVLEQLEVELPRPRDQVTTKELPEFAHLRGHVYTAIKRKQPAADAQAPPDGRPDAAEREPAATPEVGATPSSTNAPPAGDAGPVPPGAPERGARVAR